MDLPAKANCQRPRELGVRGGVDARGSGRLKMRQAFGDLRVIKIGGSHWEIAAVNDD